MCMHLLCVLHLCLHLRGGENRIHWVACHKICHCMVREGEEAYCFCAACGQSGLKGGMPPRHTWSPCVMHLLCVFCICCVCFASDLCSMHLFCMLSICCVFSNCCMWLASIVCRLHLCGGLCIWCVCYASGVCVLHLVYFSGSLSRSN